MVKIAYEHNSPQKDIVRLRWIEYATQYYKEEAGLKCISFPSEELHELELYQQYGFIDWEETETGSLKITRGRIICFEKDGPKYSAISKKLVGANVVLGEFGSVLRSKYQAIMNGSNINGFPLFPVDLINLDYDGCVATIKVPISETIEHIFHFQSMS